MVWKIKYLNSVQKDMKKIAKNEQIKIREYLEEYLVEQDDPRSSGRPLRGSLKSFWRYRVGFYRIIAQIDDMAVAALVVRIGHRINEHQKIKQ